MKNAMNGTEEPSKRPLVLNSVSSRISNGVDQANGNSAAKEQ